jgi:hypothetical protein
MASLLDNAQDRLKTGTNALALLGYKAVVGLFLGLTFALIGLEIVKYGWFSFVFVVLIVAGSLMRIARSWEWRHMLIFTLISVLIGLVLRMYILIAPG